MAKGLHRKFKVERVDPEAQGRHEKCFVFVLEPAHDPFARAALHSYAIACAATHPELASDLLDVLAQARPTLGVSGER